MDSLRSCDGLRAIFNCLGEDEEVNERELEILESYGSYGSHENCPGCIAERELAASKNNKRDNHIVEPHSTYDLPMTSSRGSFHPESEGHILRMLRKVLSDEKDTTDHGEVLERLRKIAFEKTEKNNSVFIHDGFTENQLSPIDTMNSQYDHSTVLHLQDVLSNDNEETAYSRIDRVKQLLEEFKGREGQEIVHLNPNNSVGTNISISEPGDEINAESVNTWALRSITSAGTGLGINTVERSESKRSQTLTIDIPSTDSTIPSNASTPLKTNIEKHLGKVESYKSLGTSPHSRNKLVRISEDNLSDRSEASMPGQIDAADGIESNVSSLTGRSSLTSRTFSNGRSGVFLLRHASSTMAGKSLSMSSNDLESQGTETSDILIGGEATNNINRKTKVLLKHIPSHDSSIHRERGLVLLKANESVDTGSEAEVSFGDSTCPAENSNKNEKAIVLLKHILSHDSSIHRAKGPVLLKANESEKTGSEVELSFSGSNHLSDDYSRNKVELKQILTHDSSMEEKSSSVKNQSKGRVVLQEIQNQGTNQSNVTKDIKEQNGTPTKMGKKKILGWMHSLQKRSNLKQFATYVRKTGSTPTRGKPPRPETKENNDSVTKKAQAPSYEQENVFENYARLQANNFDCSSSQSRDHLVVSPADTGVESASNYTPDTRDPRSFSFNIYTLPSVAENDSCLYGESSGPSYEIREDVSVDMKADTVPKRNTPNAKTKKSPPSKGGYQGKKGEHRPTRTRGHRRVRSNSSALGGTLDWTEAE